MTSVSSSSRPIRSFSWRFRSVRPSAASCKSFAPCATSSFFPSRSTFVLNPNSAFFPSISQTRSKSSCFSASRAIPASTCTVFVTSSCVTSWDSSFQSCCVCFRSRRVFFRPVCWSSRVSLCCSAMVSTIVSIAPAVRDAAESSPLSICARPPKALPNPSPKASPGLPKTPPSCDPSCPVLSVICPNALCPCPEALLASLLECAASFCISVKSVRPSSTARRPASTFLKFSSSVLFRRLLR